MAPFEAGNCRVRLTGMRYGAQDIVLYELEALDAADLPSVEAGAHLDLHIPGGLVRQYSLVAPLCDARRYVIGVKREERGRGGSLWLHDHARVGQILDVSAPRNHFALVHDDAPVILLAGGIGITPIYSMYRALLDQGRAVQLHYWCRTGEHALFRSTLEGQSGVTLHYSRHIDPGRKSLAQALQGMADDAHVYCCGPQAMLDELEDIGADLGPRLHLERFQAAAPAAVAEQGFTVVLARSGSEMLVSPGESILQVLCDAGVDVMYSCEQGICGACEVRVLEGEPVHADSVQSAEEHVRRGTMMVCCSSSRSSRLVLDL
ncbi:PDR/VanB family oxidoreductase [Pseudomonas sp. dw_358]|uniref:PDR/VanB family oxidoreductase n=1 Tax=Pseudomonas sp. dw_358 TaxID=2720083 RepID=UPI001BD49138|nr:PDR/VanB family oxidoreductase [Pseudomonas sp. dw_358]